MSGNSSFRLSPVWRGRFREPNQAMGVVGGPESACARRSAAV
jgi:hypothetical protein